MFLGKVKGFCFSEDFLRLARSKQVAYLGVAIALTVLVNMFSVDVTPQFKITFNYLVCFFCGAFFGPVGGFLVSFLGDTLGFLLMPGPYPYWLPTGLCTGLLAFIPGLVMNSLRFSFRGGIYVKAAIAVAAMYLVVTCGLGAYSNYLYVKHVIYAGQSYDKLFFAYLGGKILFSSVVSVVNYVLVFVLIPLVGSVKSFPLKIR